MDLGGGKAGLQGGKTNRLSKVKWEGVEGGQGLDLEAWIHRAAHCRGTEQTKDLSTGGRFPICQQSPHGSRQTRVTNTSLRMSDKAALDLY